MEEMLSRRIKVDGKMYDQSDLLPTKGKEMAVTRSRDNMRQCTRWLSFGSCRLEHACTFIHVEHDRNQISENERQRAANEQKKYDKAFGTNTEYHTAPLSPPRERSRTPPKEPEQRYDDVPAHRGRDRRYSRSPPRRRYSRSPPRRRYSRSPPRRRYSR
eukprot:Hpha_TRINITY_DN15176_c0_g13::TRINITY_DN15176_c0_g13_i3::g.127853::m.127853